MYASSNNSFEVPYSPLGLGVLGDSATQDKITQISTSAAGAVGSAFTPVIAHSIFASALTGIAPVWAIPVVGAAVFGIVLALGAILGRKGPKQKEAATRAVNSVQENMEKIYTAYFEGPRTPESRLMALTAFDEAWAWLISSDGCGNPALGDAGKRCISERQRGGNIGQAGHGDWCTNAAGCDMFASIRDPIANDPGPIPATAPAAGSASGGLLSADMGVTLPGLGSVNVFLLAGAALLAWGLASE